MATRPILAALALAVGGAAAWSLCAPGPAPLGPLRGRVVYAESGEGVPFAELSARSGRTFEVLRADARGVFTTTRDFPARVELELERAAPGGDPFDAATDPPFRARVVVERAHADEAVAVRAPLGPTCLLDLALPPGVAAEDLVAVLVPDAGPLRPVECARAGPAGPVRRTAGGEPFARFPTWASKAWSAGARVVVSTRDGRWAGEAQLGGGGRFVRRARPVLTPRVALHGVVAGEDGRPLAGLRVLCERADGAEAQSRRTDEDGAYRFDRLEPGTWSVRVRDEPWRSARETVRVAGADARRDLVARAPAPGALLPLRVVDAESGLPLPFYELLLRLPDGETLHEPVDGGARPPRRVAAGLPFTWRVQARGYRTASGHGSALEGPEPATVRLRRGFGAAVCVTSSETLAPLAGVRIFADGAPAAVTDAEGLALLDLPSAPRSLGFDPRRWTLYRGERGARRTRPASSVLELTGLEHLTYLGVTLEPVR